MPFNPAALVYVFSAIFAAFVLLPSAMFAGYRLRVTAFWLLCLPLMMFLNDQLLILLFALFFLAVLSSNAGLDRLALFLMLIPAMPLYLAAPIPFPGLNFLALINYYIVVVLAVLLPLAILIRPDKKDFHWSTVDSCFVLYILYTSAAFLVAGGLIVGLRFFLMKLLTILVPYLILSRYAFRMDIIENALKGVIVSSVILAALSLMITLKQWDFYQSIAFDPEGAGGEVRGGFLRVKATVTTHSLGFCIATAIMFLEYVKTRIKIGFLRLWVMRAVLVGGMFFTGSRGAMLGLFIALGVYFVLSVRSSSLRWALIISGGFFGAIAAYVLAFGDAGSYDAYGSFAYRKWLLDAAFAFIADYPIFGHIDYLGTGRFDHLVQGQGIIDITNLYLQIALAHGLLGLFIFVLPFIITVIRLAALAMSNRDDEGGVLYSILCGLLLGWLALIATTSDVGLIMHLGILALAFGHSLVQRRFQPTPAALKPAVA